MKFQATIEIPKGTALGSWITARKVFIARSLKEAEKKVEKDLLKLGLHRNGDYNILDIAKV